MAVCAGPSKGMFTPDHKNWKSYVCMSLEYSISDTAVLKVEETEEKEDCTGLDTFIEERAICAC